MRRLENDGRAAWAQVLKAGYEGLVAKDPASPYVVRRQDLWESARLGVTEN